MKKRIFSDQFPRGDWGQGKREIKGLASLIKFGEVDIEFGYRPKEVNEFLKKYRPPSDKVALRIVPLGASEWWGPNSRGDIWPEAGLFPNKEGSELKDAWWGYKTFEKHAHIYRHHFNFDPSLSFGNIIKSFWDPEMRRVEVIAELEKNAAPDIVEGLERGNMPEVSMGAKIPEGDYCSICGNNARSRAEYCEHLANHMTELDEEGHYIGAINTKPVFHDLSIVTVPAAKESGTLEVLEKAAGNRISSAELAEKIAYDPDQTQLYMMLHQHAPLAWKVIEREPEFPFSFLEKLASKYPLPVIASSLYSLGIVLNPLEFQTLSIANHNPELAKAYYNSRMVSPPVKTGEDFNLDLSIMDRDLVKKLSNVVEHRSGFEPYFLARYRGIVKQASAKPFKKFQGDALLNKIASFYFSYKEKVFENLPQLVDFYEKAPLALHIFGVDGVEKTASFQEGLESAATKLYFYGWKTYHW